MDTEEGGELKVLILTLSGSGESRGRKCLPILLAQLAESGATSSHVELRSLPPVWVDGRDLEEYPAPYGELFAAVQRADAVILVLPVYCYTASSPAKALTEILGDAFAEKPVAFVTAAGSTRSHLAARDIMASMMFEQATICFPVTVQVTKESFMDGELNADAVKRLKLMAADFTLFAGGLRAYVQARLAREEE